MVSAIPASPALSRTLPLLVGIDVGDGAAESLAAGSEEGVPLGFAGALDAFPPSWSDVFPSGPQATAARQSAVVAAKAAVRAFNTDRSSPAKRDRRRRSRTDSAR